ncbi:MAG: hypothetical protein AB1499_01960 [Nitrospirota bacterium]
MDETYKLITEILDDMRPLIEAHKGVAEMGTFTGSRAVIYCGGKCISCQDKCIEAAIKEKLPDIEIVFV